MPGARLKQTPERKGTLIMIQSPKALHALSHVRVGSGLPVLCR